MASNLSQNERFASLTTALGKEELAIQEFDGNETLSKAYEYRVIATSENRNVDLDKIIGNNACITLEASGSLHRKFNGVVTDARLISPEHELTTYEIILRPWLWLLSHTTNCKIFESKTVVEIVKAVFEDAGFKDFSDRTSESYPTIEYCVQYRESSMDFVCRLMEEFGIYFYFEHSDDKHMLVMVDAKSCLLPIPGVSAVVYLPLESEWRRDREFVSDWSVHRSLQSGRVTLKDYNYLKPNADMLSKDSDPGKYSHADLEIFDYPGRYVEKGDGDKLAKVRLQSEQAKDHRRFARGNAIALFPGGLTKLERHYTDGENVEYLVVSCRHRFVAQHYRSGGPAGGEPYIGDYELLPSDKPYRAPQETPKPVISGPQTAKVVCEKGEEIDVDKHGRITVQFYWNREKTISRRVRIAQVWSGKSWGGIVIPRKDQEVVVQFLEGDPDQPLVIGTVYNDENKVPYGLPANKTIAGVKSESTKGGGGYNEFIFEDKKGQEEIKMHAERNLDVEVEHDEIRKVHNNQEETVDMKVTKTVGMSEEVTIGTTYNLEANVMIELKCGLSKITMTPASISIESPNILITGQATLTSKAPMVTSTSDAMTNIVSSGMITVTGQMTQISGGKCPMPPLTTPSLTVF